MVAPMLLAAAERDPSAAALIDARTGTTWSYARLKQAVDAVARGLQNDVKGVVAWISRSVPNGVAGYLGALASGNAVIPLAATLSDDLFMRILDAYEPEVLLTLEHDPVPPAVEHAYGRQVSLLGEPADEALVVRRRRTASTGVVQPDVCLLLSTSGSTGSPKMVRLAQRNVTSNAEGIATALEIDHRERAVTSLPLFYSFGLSVLHSHLVAGAALLLTERSLFETEFWDALADHGCTSLAGVPYTYGMLHRVGLARRAPPSLRTLTQAGGKMSNDLIAHFHELMAARGGRLFVMYGQTEATARITVLPPHLLPAKLGGVGFPLAGGNLTIHTPRGGPAEANAVGEVVYRGPNVMLGYAGRRADLDRGDELDGTLRTGDLGYLDADGCLFITGRSKRIAKVFGLRLSLDDLEARLAPVGPVALLSGDDIVEVYAPSSREGAVREAIRALASSLKLNTRGFQLRVVDALPLLPNGKVDYRRLREPATEDAGRTPPEEIPT